MTAPAAVVDVNVPRFNQAMVAVLLAVGFVVQWWPLVGLAAAILAATRFGGPRWGLFTRGYLRWIRPRLNGPIATEEANPPRFAQLLGTAFLALATGLFLTGWTAAGWGVALIVFALALLAATTRICVGCLIYQRAVS